MFKSNTRFSTKLGLGIMLMAVPIFILALGILFINSRNFIRQKASERATSALNVSMHNVKKYLLTVENATNANTWFIENNFHPDSLLALSRRIVMMNRNAYGCSISAEPDIFPECGRYFSVYTVTEGDTIISAKEGDYEYFKKVWYKTAIDAGKAIWVDPFEDDAEGDIKASETIASYCKPLWKDGRVVGVISTDISFNKLSKIINSADLPYPDAYFVVVGKEGRYLMHPDSTRIFKSNIFNDYSAYNQAGMRALGYEMIEGKSGQMHVDINGRHCHVSYCTIPSTSWSMALICPDKEILKSYNQLTNLIIVLILVGLLLILWLCRQAVGHALKPIAYLLDTLKKITNGEYDNQIPHTQREDAIGKLQNAFATMQQSIDDHVCRIRQASREAQQRNEELTKAMQLAEKAVAQKTLFIQNVSHQIRTPLNIISGFAQVLQDNPSMPEKDLAEITSMMNHNTRHLNRMVLMLFDSSDSGAVEELKSHRNDLVPCNQLARDCISYTQEIYQDVTINMESDLPDSCQIKTNRLYLTRSLHELLYNAAKYSDAQHITIRLTQTETTVRFTVEDTGSELPEELVEQMFQPFIKIDDLSEGLGLGLPLAKRHAISLGGDLFLDKSYHGGCRFIIEMPKE